MTTPDIETARRWLKESERIAQEADRVYIETQRDERATVRERHAARAILSLAQFLRERALHEASIVAARSS